MSDFPETQYAFPSNGERGMTLRDWFAGQALAGVIDAAARVQNTPKMEELATRISSISYLIADAMMKEREEKQ
jgi:hypothetical protein